MGLSELIQVSGCLIFFIARSQNPVVDSLQIVTREELLAANPGLLLRCLMADLLKILEAVGRK
jgi:hypothetical protein